VKKQVNKHLTIILTVLIAILTPPLATASTPSYTFNHNQTAHTILPENTSTMQTTISLDSYQSENHNLQGYTDKNYQEKDQITNQQNTLLQITFPDQTTTTLNNGNSLILQTNGTYQVTNNANTSQNYTINTTQKPKPTISIQQPTQQGLTFTTSPKQKQFISQGQSQTYTTTIQAQEGLRPDTYTPTLRWRNQNGKLIESQDLTINIPKRLRFNITNNIDAEKTIESGGQTDFGSILVQNTGNTAFTVTQEENGTARNFIKTVDEFQVFPDQNTTVEYFSQVPLETNPNTYNYNTTLRTNETEKKISFNVTVDDKTPPDIESIEWTNFEAGAKTNLTVIAQDENQLGNGYITINNENKSLTRNQNKYTWNNTFTRTGQLPYTIYINDESNNTVTKNSSITIQPNTVFDYNEAIQANTVRTNTFTETELFNYTEEIINTPTITLTGFVTDERENYNIRLRKPSGSTTDIDLNETIEVDEAGQWQLETTNVESESDYDLTFQVSTTDYLENPQEFTINVEGKIRQYTVPDDFTTRLGPNTVQRCEATDTGKKDTSKITCTAEYPIDTQLQTQPVIQTKSTVNEIFQDMNETRQSNERLRATNYTLIALNIVLVLLVALGSVWLVEDYPRFRRQ